MNDPLTALGGRLPVYRGRPATTVARGHPPCTLGDRRAPAEQRELLRRPGWQNQESPGFSRAECQTSFLITAQHAMLGRMKMECCVSAPGRVCFAGEKLDWTGGSAIICAVDDLRVYVR